MRGVVSSRDLKSKPLETQTIKDLTWFIVIFQRNILVYAALCPFLSRYRPQGVPLSSRDSSFQKFVINRQSRKCKSFSLFVPRRYLFLLERS
jgi:hypothetical protein